MTKSFTSENKKECRQDLSRTTFAILIFLVSYHILSSLYHFLIMQLKQIGISIVILECLYPIGTLLIYLIISLPLCRYILKKQSDFQVFSFKVQHELPLKDLAPYFLMSIAPILLMLGVEGLLVQLGQIDASNLVPNHPITLWQLVITNLTVLPFIEEIVFRALCVPSLKKHGWYFAILISTFIFAIGHGDLGNFLLTLIPGFIYGYLALKTHSIRYSVIFHILTNVLGSFILPLIFYCQITPLTLVIVFICFLLSLIGFYLLLVKRKYYFEPNQGLSTKATLKLFFTTPVCLFLLLYCLLVLVGLL